MFFSAAFLDFPRDDGQSDLLGLRCRFPHGGSFGPLKWGQGDGLRGSKGFNQMFNRNFALSQQNNLTEGV